VALIPSPTGIPHNNDSSQITTDLPSQKMSPKVEPVATVSSMTKKESAPKVTELGANDGQTSLEETTTATLGSQTMRTMTKKSAKSARTAPEIVESVSQKSEK
jgi:hypothetical protein